jgi:hypothetical protein
MKPDVKVKKQSLTKYPILSPIKPLSKISALRGEIHVPFFNETLVVTLEIEIKTLTE